MDNHKHPGDELPIELQALLQYRRANSNPNPPSLLPPGHQTVAHAQTPPVFGANEVERLHNERDKYHSLYIDSNQDLNRAQQVLNHVMHQINNQDIKI